MTISIEQIQALYSLRYKYPVLRIDYPFNTITPISTLIRGSITCYGLIWVKYIYLKKFAFKKTL